MWSNSFSYIEISYIFLAQKGIYLVSIVFGTMDMALHLSSFINGKFIMYFGI